MRFAAADISLVSRVQIYTFFLILMPMGFHCISASQDFHASRAQKYNALIVVFGKVDKDGKK